MLHRASPLGRTPPPATPSAPLEDVTPAALEAIPQLSNARSAARPCLAVARRVPPSRTGHSRGELILVEGTSCTVLDDELEQTAAFEVGALGHDLTVIALDGAIHTQNVRGAARFISARTSGRTYL